MSQSTPARPATTEAADPGPVLTKTYYTASATASGDRRGRVACDDGTFDLELSMPKGLGGLGGRGTNPEQLFAATYAACFESAINLVARNERLDVRGTSVTARVHIGEPPEGGFGIAAELTARIPALSREQAEDIVHKAHEVCPYSRATRGNIDVRLSVEE
jgi:lipoyl-dependent peroxiredoxin